MRQGHDDEVDRLPCREGQQPVDPAQHRVAADIAWQGRAPVVEEADEAHALPGGTELVDQALAPLAGADHHHPQRQHAAPLEVADQGRQRRPPDQEQKQGRRQPEGRQLRRDQPLPEHGVDPGHQQDRRRDRLERQPRLQPRLLERGQAIGGGELEKVQCQERAQRQRKRQESGIDGLRPRGHAAGEEHDRAVRRPHQVEQQGRLQVPCRTRRGLLQNRIRPRTARLFHLGVEIVMIYRVLGEKGKISVQVPRFWN